MDSTFIVERKTLKRIPFFMGTFFILFLGLPILVLNDYEKNFNPLHELELHHYLGHLLFLWSLLMFATLSTFMALIHARLTGNRITLFMGLSLLSSSLLIAIHPAIITNTSDVIAWLLVNIISSGILFIGLFFIALKKKIMLIESAFFAFLAALSLFFFHGSWESKISYEIIGLCINLTLITLLLPKILKKKHDLFIMCIFVMTILQIGITLDLGYFAHQSAINLAAGLQLTLFFIPFSCFLLHYVFSYHSLLEHQRKTEFKNNQLTYLASHDELTNLYNRREFEYILDKMIASHERSKTSFALFLIDLDNFKSVNDALGHEQGDEYLKKFSSLLTSLTRQGDFLSRHGGDEFMLIMSSYDSIIGAKKLAYRLINGIQLSYPKHQSLFPLTMSIGIAIYPNAGKSSKKLIRNADVAMYHAKNAGKNTFRIYSKKLKSKVLVLS